MIIYSRKPKVREILTWVVKSVNPRGFSKMIEEKQKEITYLKTKRAQSTKSTKRNNVIQVEDGHFMTS